MRLGFVGTGTITAAMVRGLKRSALADWPVLVSPRNAQVAAALAADLPGVTVAASTQAVVDGADLVILAVRPQVAQLVLRALRFGADQPVISLIAGLSIATITQWTGARHVTRAVPLPFVEQGRDITPVHPADPQAMALFGALGRALPVDDAAQFDVFAALSAQMGTYFGVIATAETWAKAQGLPATAARAYLAGLFGNLGDVMRASDATPDALRIGHSTAGGLNEQVFARFAEAGGTQALTGALQSVLDRIRKA